MKKYHLLFLCFLIYQTAFAQEPLLISGPWLGYCEHRSVYIGYEVSQEVRSATIRYWDIYNTDYYYELDYKGQFGLPYNVIHFELGKLLMNTKYQYEIRLNGKTMSTERPCFFTTKDLWEHRKPAPDFSFLTGSCAYINDPPYDRPGKPAYGQDPVIFKTMAVTAADFNLWLGDNLYFREADYSSFAGMQYRYSFQRRNKELSELLQARPNYAIWDDHDFGPNDSDKEFELKQDALKLFKEYWGNKSFGETDNAGTYSKFSWSDCDFFLTDDRYYRAPNNLRDSTSGKPNCNKEFFGKRQMEWLKNSLLSSDATFKFIVVGSQVLNPMAQKECFRHSPCEFNELMDFIADYKIPGIVFISGDRHFSEVISWQPVKGYKLYDITSSPLTSAVYQLKGKAEENNPNRVESTLVEENCYTKISVSGEAADRSIKMITLNKNGEIRAQFSLKASDLKF